MRGPYFTQPVMVEYKIKNPPSIAQIIGPTSITLMWALFVTFTHDSDLVYFKLRWSDYFITD